MESVSKKRRHSVVPKQKKDDRIGKWDENGGVFTQENPRLSYGKQSYYCDVLW